MKIRNVVVIVAMVMTLSLMFSASLRAADSPAQGGKQSLCPVMNYNINKAFYVDIDGKRIYVCCAQCVDTIKSNPAPYLEKLEKQGVVLEKTP